MTSKASSTSKMLALSQRATEWLEQFEPADTSNARELLDALTLVSHNEFERALTGLIESEAGDVDGTVALFATRELRRGTPFFVAADQEVTAVGSGVDLGSEARVAAMIRGLSRAQPAKFLNHPNVKTMRAKKCRAIFAVDDFIGSGERTNKFISSMWLNSSIRSWNSYGLISIRAVAYSATLRGKQHVERSPGNIRVSLHRDCPTFREMPWQAARTKKILNLLGKYGQKTSRPGSAMGYGSSAAALVFEHGCPNNCPSILWAPTSPKSSWTPLFPERSVLLEEASAFPPEISRRDPSLVMIQAGQKRLAASAAFTSSGPIDVDAITVLAIAARGIRSRSALSHATGLAAAECGRLLERCILWGFLTPTYRLTSTGLAELNYARNKKIAENDVPSVGSNNYYPKQLRRPVIR